MLIRSALVSLLALSVGLGVGGCAVPTTGDQGGAVQTNDRSATGTSGESLSVGVMLVSPSGRFSLLQRADASVIVDLEKKTTRELPFYASRFVFAHDGTRGYAFAPGAPASVVAFDLETVTEAWRVSPSITTPAVFSISDDDANVIVAGEGKASVVATKSGALTGEIFLPSFPTNLTFLPAAKSGTGSAARAVFVGSTEWTAHQPKTALSIVDLATLDQARVDVPNCSAPLVVVPDASRAFLSPTFCQEDRPSTETVTWTNPDPVSVIDFDAKGAATFRENLPGFGPVALDKAGSVAVAYLDTARMDPAMFKDKDQVPAAGADPYQLMVIDPHSLTFTLTPIGHSLPRFAMGRDGKSLLVDASVRVERVSAQAKVTVDANGIRIEAGATFGSDAPFGTFDLARRKYTAFTGPLAALDRFVQTKNGHVFTLKATADGLGGDLFDLDLAAHTTKSMGRSLRDIGILPDGETLLLRVRLPAVKHDDGFHRAEQICFSLDGSACSSTITYESVAPIPNTSATCTGSHDC